ncbi:MAG TPA: hypothetical protein VFL62_18720 [Bradyrhizobium sp.]|uniref:hypothetical protein n=1 Tax=Bradyrhizobium sp. TaxID=376 RepID=UPI002D7E1536|nr:hypothetical protein [Bradyrhizobium sp.]HET7888261.1 hypothetical protein [Bradyrhizobium sp.]
MPKRIPNRRRNGLPEDLAKGLAAKRRAKGRGAALRRLHVGLVTAALTLAVLAGASAPSAAQPVLASSVPLAFGMSPDEVSAALGVPLGYISGSRGNELLLALPNVKGSALTIRSDGLYLQFRRGRLSGWKGDWGTARPPVVGW